MMKPFIQTASVSQPFSLIRKVPVLGTPDRVIRAISFALCASL